MASKVVAALDPRWHGPVDDALERGAALARDRDAAEDLLRRPAATEADLDRDGGVVYGKGAAVLRMMEAWIGADAFQRGVRAYLADHARGNATTDDLLDALAAHSDAPGLARAFATFLDQAGAPRVAARIDCTPGAVKVTVHGILTSGSSRHGKLRRAALGSCWVNTYQRSSTSWRNVPTVQKSATGAV